MGKLKPIGSEKLQGMEKISRMIEISRYKENVPNSINEDSSVEYKKRLSDGYDYQIIKEKNGYVIKKALNESELDYIEPMKNRKYYSSYSNALKRLNLIAKEVNVNEGYDNNVSLFGESENHATKYILKMKSEIDEQDVPPAPVPAPAPAPAPAPSPEPTPEVEPTDMGDEMPSDDMGSDEMSDDEEPITFKTIQKLTGKLAQKIRTLVSDEENPMTSKDIKYVINSVLSAFDLNQLDEEDLDEIMSKFEGEDMGSEDMGTEDMGGEEPDMSAEVPSAPEEMTEMENEDTTDWKDAIKDIFNEENDVEDMESKKSRIKHHRMDDGQASKMEEMIESLFGESNVDKVLKKYFVPTKSEKLISEQRKKQKQKIVNRNETIQMMSENVEQEITARKFVNKYPEAKLLGKTKKNNIVFKLNETQYRITPNGKIL